MEDYSSATLKADINYIDGVAMLNLSEKGLSRLPDAVTELSEVGALWLSGNNLTELSTSINKLKNLRSLYLSVNKLAELPPEICDLKELEKLFVSSNQLVGLPSSIEKLNKLKCLRLRRNNLKELPAGVGDLMELTTLDVSENQLVGLPTTVKKLNKLKELYLDGNKITELPPDIFYLKELIALNVGMNQLVVLPSNIQKPSKLTWLNLDKNKLTELPAEIGDLKELWSLNVSNNQLVGLPTSIQKLDKLEVLFLDNNKLKTLPAEIGDLKELWWLNVSDNQLVGLPASLQKLNKLQVLHLYLRNNKLTELPAGIGDLKELSWLYVSGNPLNFDAIRFAQKLKNKGKFINTDIAVPSEIQARGESAERAYQSALRDGAVNVYRSRVLLIGQDRAGKTSLKKSLIGLPFNPIEESTEGIEVDPSVFQVDIDEVKNWQPIDESNQGLLGCSKDVAKVVVEKLYNPVSRKFVQEKNEGEEKHANDLQNDDSKNGEEVGDTDGEKKGDSCVKQSSGPDHELTIDTTSSPDDIREHAVELIIKSKKGEGAKEESALSIELWDFAGQDLYYASHPLFLTSRAIYVLSRPRSCNELGPPVLHDIAQPCVKQGKHDVFLDNPNGETNLENLLSWLSTVHSITQMRGETCNDAEGELPHLRPPVIIVGTHADKPFEDIATMKLEIQRAIAGKDYEGHVVRHIFSIDNTANVPQSKFKKFFKRGRAGQDKSVDKIEALRAEIMEVLKHEPFMGERIPVRWLNFEKIISALLSKDVYHLNIKDLQAYAKDICFIDDEEEFSTMVNFYHDLGIIIEHCSTVILSAKWLIDLLRQLITIPPYRKMDPKVAKHWKEVEESGVLSMKLIDHVFCKFLLKGVVRGDILGLMEKFGLIAKFALSKTDEKFFVPSLLKVPPDSICAMVPSSSDPCPLYAFFITGFVPHGLFSQLVSRLVRWCSEAGPTQPPTLYRNGAWFVIGRQTVHDLVVFCKKQYIKFFVKQRSQDQQVSGDKGSEVAIQVREFVEATLQALSRDLLYLRGMQYQICVACPYCQLEKCSDHKQLACAHVDCRHLLEIRPGDPLICKKKPSNKVLTVKGLEKWFSQMTSEELYPPSPSVTAQRYLQGSNLKVTLLANEWGSSKGGLSTINRTLAIHLAKHANVEVTILVPEFECGEDDKRDAKGHNIAIMEAQRRPGFSDPLDWLCFPPRDRDIQVVIGHGAKLGKQAQIIQDSHCCKWVQVVHTEPEELAMYKNYPGAITKGEGKNRAEVELCQLADLVVTVGPKLTEAFSSYLRSSHQDVFQLMPGTFKEFSDVEHATTRASAKFKVLTFGRGDFEDFTLKGYDIAAQAIVELKDSSYRLIFVGAPDGKQDEVAEILCQTGISRNQLFVRSFLKDKQRLEELFCEVDVAIMPSRTEGFGLTALEAMSAGLPILVSGNSGFGEALRCLPKGMSFVIDSDDPKEWAKAIAAIRQKSRAQRLEEIQRLRRSYEERFSWERQCQSLVDTMWKMVYGKKSNSYESKNFATTVAFFLLGSSFAPSTLSERLKRLTDI
ncbi:unnamed protein product [Porites evermanni]|uniref:Disease resistance R13L4/SHOC-2-like LRR domain-containing protein n=1 Tax=Porites evermanni TaxID=104178 RepID=A0ABN8LIQ7_9CNID|nr:unnamed protein product [Porites evermanni]